MQDDEILGKAYDARLMRRLLQYLRPYWRPVALAFVAIIIGAAASLAQPYLMKMAIDRYIAAGAAGRRSTGSRRCTSRSCVVAFAAEYIQTWTMQLTGQRIMFDLRMAIYGHLQRLDLPLLRPQSGRPADDARHLRRRRPERSLHVGRRHGLRRRVHARSASWRDAVDELAAGAGHVRGAAADRR